MSENVIFAVTAGSYEEPRVLSIWDTRKSAEDECIRAKEELNVFGLNVYVEEHPFNTPSVSNYWDF